MAHAKWKNGQLREHPPSKYTGEAKGKASASNGYAVRQRQHEATNNKSGTPDIMAGYFSRQAEDGEIEKEHVFPYW